MMLSSCFDVPVSTTVFGAYDLKFTPKSIDVDPESHQFVDISQDRCAHGSEVGSDSEPVPTRNRFRLVYRFRIGSALGGEMLCE